MNIHKELKQKQKFIRDWAVIWIWCISLVITINTIFMIQVYTKKTEDKLLDNFQSYCDEALEKGGVEI